MTKLIKLLLVVASLFMLAACDRAPSNVKTLQTTDCGQTWIVIAAGQRIPSTVGTCSYNTVLPDYPMQGDTEFLSQFGKVLVKIKISYDYEIVDGIKFLKVAKFLGKSASTAEKAAGDSKMSALETAENVVIDVRFRELTTSTTATLDIVTFNPSEFEDKLFKMANTDLASRGVALNSITFVTIVEDQTRMAIDAATAMQVYRSNNMEDLGKQLVIARAGATQVVVHQSPAK